MKKILLGASAIVLAASISAPAVAHHSAAMFDMGKTITLNGVVKDFQYTNPHSWLVVTVKGDDGKEVEWSFEAEGPSTLLRAGVKKSTLPAGAAVTMRTHPMKDGRPAGWWIDLTKADGTVIDPHPAATPAPAAGK
jgi:hypothetical protein